MFREVCTLKSSAFFFERSYEIQMRKMFFVLIHFLPRFSPNTKHHVVDVDWDG